jgi:hypothetical protein
MQQVFKRYFVQYSDPDEPPGMSVSLELLYGGPPGRQKKERVIHLDWTTPYRGMAWEFRGLHIYEDHLSVLAEEPDLMHKIAALPRTLTPPDAERLVQQWGFQHADLRG